MLKNWAYRWGPAVLIMAVIFAFSSRPSADLPDFGNWDHFMKKAAHALGYGLLALAYWRGWGFERSKKWFAWGLAICYAVSDEFHQGFVAGRHPSLLDVLVFDNVGAIVGLTILALRRRQN
jgi:VanZ family protein